ncbi:tetratricopeptide repeat protein [Aquimonas sp.]|jgi:tetratricopeptide (TPR) repeat protein|uniref:tetratricopeptide repeat protein n=1 Tax=Aquimonas sp. TaxID=1872588 RepID=UPI0037BEBFA0
MLLFLQIVAAVVLVLLVLAVLAWWGFKRWLRRKIGHYAASAALVDPRYSAPARIHLQLAETVETEPDFDRLWAQAQALGFQRLAELETREGEPALLRVATHPDLPYALALSQHSDAVHFSLLAIDDGQRLRAVSDGPGESIHSGTLHWDVDASTSLADAFQRLQQACAGRSLRSFDLRLFRLVFERAHARRQDAWLARPPQRAEVARRGALQTPPSNEQTIDQALQNERQLWQQAVRTAVLDHYRQISRIDADSWERMGDDLHVVHAQMSRDDIGELLVHTDAETALLQQLHAQGLSGSALYEALAERLPSARQRRRLFEVRQPLHAWIYARAEETAPAASVARTHLYSATQADGSSVGGSVLARNSAEAVHQLDALGLRDARVVGESMPMGELPDFMLNPEFAAIAARSAREGIGLGVARALLANALLWAPPLLLSAWSLLDGAPFSWGDYLAFAYLAVAAVALLVLIGPMVLYNQLLSARLHGRKRTARLCLALLGRLNLMGGLRPDQLALERAKLIAEDGQLDAAVSYWNRGAAQLEEAQLQTGLAQIFDAAGSIEQAIAAQRAVLKLLPIDMSRIDLALTLAKHAPDTHEAEAVLAEVDSRELSELAQGGLHFARGLLASRSGDAARALVHFSKAQQQLAQFQSNPLVLGLIAEINGYAALTLKQSGEADRAQALWQNVRPLLEKHASCRALIARYEGRQNQWRDGSASSG